MGNATLMTPTGVDAGASNAKQVPLKQNTPGSRSESLAMKARRDSGPRGPQDDDPDADGLLDDDEDGSEQVGMRQTVPMVQQRYGGDGPGHELLSKPGGAEFLLAPHHARSGPLKILSVFDVGHPMVG